MTQTLEMLRTHPSVKETRSALIDCIDACFSCAEVCITCADACLAEPMVANLVRCIRINSDCATICAATGEVLARQVEPDERLIRAQVLACEIACRVCAEECERHGGEMAHCAVCAAACRQCEKACGNLLAQI